MMSNNNPETILFFLFSVFCLWMIYTRYRYHDSHRGMSPPGPWPLPIIGNLHQAPVRDMFETYRRWHQKYGPIIRLQYGNKTIISLGSYQVAHDLLDKKSAIYSSRPKQTVLQYFTRGLSTVLLPYGPRWRVEHAIHASILGSSMIRKYQPLQDLESKQLIHEMLQAENTDWTKNFQRFSLSLVFAPVYGTRLESAQAAAVQEIEDLASIFQESAEQPMNLFVELYPILNRLPSWATSWKREGAVFHERMATSYGSYLAMAQTTGAWNWAKSLVQNQTHNFTHKELAFILGILLEASMTTSTVLQHFVVAAVLHPAAVSQAQQEIDAIVGLARMPDLYDIQNLPYVESFVREVLRWRPIAPLAVPHSNDAADVYNGYHIAKDTMVVPNIWSIHLDEDVYQNATEFQPERWLKNLDLPLAAFGFGRRVCPGQQLGKQSLFITVSRILWAYNISHAYENGKKVELDPWNVTQSTLSSPLCCKASFAVRSPEHQRVIEMEWDRAEKDVNLVLDTKGTES